MELEFSNRRSGQRQGRERNGMQLFNSIQRCCLLLLRAEFPQSSCEGCEKPQRPRTGLLCDHMYFHAKQASVQDSDEDNFLLLIPSSTLEIDILLFNWGSDTHKCLPTPALTPAKEQNGILGPWLYQVRSLRSQGRRGSEGGWERERKLKDSRT